MVATSSTGGFLMPSCSPPLPTSLQGVHILSSLGTTRSCHRDFLSMKQAHQHTTLLRLDTPPLPCLPVYHTAQKSFCSLPLLHFLQDAHSTDANVVPLWRPVWQTKGLLSQ